MPSLLLIAALLSSGFGPPVSGLQLAVKMDHKGRSATFSIRNKGTQPITFIERYSCSGRSHFSISVGKAKAKLDIHYHDEPKAKGLTTRLTTRCTRNGPVKWRTVAPGQTTTITIPFDKPGEILRGRHKFFRANALLMLSGNSQFTRLHSARAAF